MLKIKCVRPLGIILSCDDRWRHIVIYPASDVDKIEPLFHPFGHSFGETGEFFADVLFECRASPAPHFLYFSVLKARERQGICTSAAERMRVDSINRDSFVSRVAQDCSGHFYAGSNIRVRYVETRVV